MTSASTEGRRAITAADIETILVRNLGAAPEVFAPSASLQEMGFDSLALLELQAIVRDQFFVDIPDDGLQMTVAEIVAAANEELGG